MSARESFTASERELLDPFLSDAEAPVFALLGLPEETRGALFARYSRYPGTLRRLLLDEFAEELRQAPSQRVGAGTRAGALYERVLGEYGDDSVAQLGGAHIACEHVSNVLTKVLQRPRLGSYLEQSTRYIPYDRPMPGGGYRYHREPALAGGYEQAMDGLFETYGRLLGALPAWLAERFPPTPNESGAAHERALRAKALDLVRGLLPASALSHVGIHASGQTFERLILHLRAHPLPEARRVGEEMLAAMRVAAPSFVTRVDRDDRGGEWVRFLTARAAAGERVAARLGLGGGAGGKSADGEKTAVRLGLGSESAATETHVRLLSTEGDEAGLLAALLFEHSAVSEEKTRTETAELTAAERAQMLADLLGGRANRRHLPGRGLESLRYRFEIVSDYGAFRDLQRHRMLTVQWQPLGPHLGAEIPEEISLAGFADPYEAALELSREAWRELIDAGLEDHAPYALCMAFRVRYVLDLNAREAMHLIELRSGGEGHAAYRRIAREMHAQIASVHPGVAAAMVFLDAREEPRLERLEAEARRSTPGAG